MLKRLKLGKRRVVRAVEVVFNMPVTTPMSSNPGIAARQDAESIFDTGTIAFVVIMTLE